MVTKLGLGRRKLWSIPRHYSIFYGETNKKYEIIFNVHAKI
jgi:hypothetical protein